MSLTTSPTIICCGDGGLQGSFIAGALASVYHLSPENFAKTTHILATSASMATLMYYLSGNGPQIGEKIWTQDIPSSQFLSFTSIKSLFGTDPVYNIPYLVNVVFRQNNPLDEVAVRATPWHFAFPILNIDTREVEIFSNRPQLAKTLFPQSTIRNWLDYDLYELIHACCAIPILYDRPVKLGNHRYCDAGIITPYLAPQNVSTDLRALYLVVRQRTVWSHDWKLILTGLIWQLRALRGKTGLPSWVYGLIVKKPFTLNRLTQTLQQTIPKLTLISASTPLMSSLQNTSESALHNWKTGQTHVRTHTASITRHFN